MRFRYLLLALLLTGCVRPLPGPQPAPLPPAPIVAPVIVAPVGFRVMIVYETEAANSRDQLAVIYSTAITEYLNDHCVKGPGGRPEWRRWDKDTQPLDSESKDIRDLWDAVKPKLGALPQLVIAKDGKADIYPLPNTEAEVLNLLSASEGGK